MVIIIIIIIIAWSRDHPEKLIVPQLVKKFLAFYGTRRFITAFTTACHLYPILGHINPIHVSP